MLFQKAFFIWEVFEIKQKMMSYYRSKNKDVEFIYAKNSEDSFQEHNHISTYTIGLLIEGSIKLYREFKKQVGLTPHHFKIQNRIRKVQHMLLENKQASITEVALAMGFYDQSHFIKSFKKIVGLSPCQYVNAQYLIND